MAISTTAQIAIITAAFGSVYPIVRSLPDAKCEFLHYDKVEGSDAELCLDDEGSAIFYDMERLKFPVELSVTDIQNAKAGETVTVGLHFQTDLGKPINFEDLAIVHTERLHMFVIDETLEDYHHVHPQEAEGAGNFTFSFEPRRAGTYTLYAESVAQRSRSVVIARSTIEIGDSPSAAFVESSLMDADLPEGVEFSFEALGGFAVPGYPNDVVIRIQSPEGNPIQFEETMGSLCHLAAFDRDGRGFAHLHPLDEGVGVGTEETSFSFVFNTNEPGDYKFWAQFMLNGKDLFVPFKLTVE